MPGAFFGADAGGAVSVTPGFWAFDRRASRPRYVPGSIGARTAGRISL